MYFDLTRLERLKISKLLKNWCNLLKRKELCYLHKGTLINENVVSKFPNYSCCTLENATNKP